MVFADAAADFVASFAVILAAGFCAGAVNAVAGGGTLISFPVLVWLGRDPIVANATNALALWPGALAGAVGFRRELAGSARLLALLLPAAVAGAATGAILLLRTPTRMFGAVVPYLVLLASLLVAAQRPLMRLRRADETQGAAGPRLGLFFAQILISIYGGYFGAGMGILMLAALGFTGAGDIHRRNGVKNVLAATTNGVAAAGFALSGVVSWPDAGALGAGAIAGGYTGAALGRRLDKRAAELVVLAIGLGATASLLAR